MQHCTDLLICVIFEHTHSNTHFSDTGFLDVTLWFSASFLSVSLSFTNLYWPGHAESAVLPIEWVELFSIVSVCVCAGVSVCVCARMCTHVSMGTAGLLVPLIRGRPVCMNACIVGSCVFRAMACVILCVC